ncbi:hypothetical protein TSUD_346100 [Trifolium subterraneum]|nr:hypothetical protein TSUD_346100 [Trifolium subterraneum]
MSECKVTLESKLTVVSSRPVKSGKTHKLSGVDHRMGYHTLHLIFYYKNQEKWFESFELDPLRESLSEVLSIYPTVTGRLAREKEEDGDWEVKCNDAGVRVIKANVDCTIDEWLSSSASGSDEKQLIAWDDMPRDTSTWSPFRIQPEKVYDQNHSLSICRDFRKLIKPSLPIGYFGNALHFSNLSIKVQEMENGQLEDIANLIHKHLNEVTEEEIWSSIESFETQKESMPKCMYGSELTCVYMEEEEALSLLYESMFSNSEKPAHVSCRIGNVDDEGLITVMPSSEGGFARNVIVMLQEEELDKLCNDQEILKLEPTIILAGCRVQH